MTCEGSAVALVTDGTGGTLDVTAGHVRGAHPSRLLLTIVAWGPWNSWGTALFICLGLDLIGAIGRSGSGPRRRRGESPGKT